MKYEKEYKIGDEVWFTEGYNVGHGIVRSVKTYEELRIPADGYGPDNIFRRKVYGVDGLYDTGVKSGYVHENLIFLYDSKQEAEKSFSL